MTKVLADVVINEKEAEPLSDYVLDFLIGRKKECPNLDFKLKIDISKNSNFPELAKDIFAICNYGGGWILIGWEERISSQYFPVGLPDDYHVDGAILQEKFNSYSNIEIEIIYTEFERAIEKERKRFAAIYIPSSYDILKPIKEGKYKKGEKEKIVFKKDDIFYRRGSQSIHPSSYEMELIHKRIKDKKECKFEDKRIF